MESFNDCFSVKTWSTIKVWFAITSVFNKLTLSSRERQGIILDSFEDFIGASQVNGDTTGAAVEELFPTVLDENKSCSDSALIQ